jgi:chlorite dismutase
MPPDKSKINQKETNDKKNDINSPTKYLNFCFYKVDPKWRWLNDIGKDEAAKEFSSLIDIANTKRKVRAYSTIGIRKESDFMLWSISDSIEKIQVLASKVYTTVLGKYIDTSEVYLSASRPSIYSSKITPSFMEDGEPLKHNIVYPFIKSREWYLLPFEKRSEMMKEHISVAKKFPQIRLNTSYSFGMGDQDFMLAFETDNLMDFQDLIMKLRETQVNRYVVKDTPMIVCVHKKIFDIIKSLG